MAIGTRKSCLGIVETPLTHLVTMGLESVVRQDYDSITYYILKTNILLNKV